MLITLMLCDYRTPPGAADLYLSLYLSSAIAAPTDQLLNDIRHTGDLGGLDKVLP